MRNPAKLLTEQFVLRSPFTLLVAGTALAVVDLLTIYAAASKDGVIRIEGGVGLVNHYGLMSTIAGNAISFYVAKKYYDGVCSITESQAVQDKTVVQGVLDVLRGMVELRDKYRFIMYFLILIGAFFFLSNFGTHIWGDPGGKWGKVLDSAEYRWSFVAGRLHNIYTWIVIMPLVVHVMVCSSIQLKRAVDAASQAAVLKYDLLNPDRRGGFALIVNSAITFNFVAALVYIEIILHSETFGRRNMEHIFDYALFLFAVLFVNKMFFTDMYATVKKLRIESLNKVKEQVFQNNTLSFEILKFCYEGRINRLEVANVLVQASAIVIPGLVQFWPQIARVFIRA
jgi:hypothetical protein